jgi:hypothetical protein
VRNPGLGANAITISGFGDAGRENTTRSAAISASVAFNESSIGIWRAANAAFRLEKLSGYFSASIRRSTLKSCSSV